MSPLPRYEMKIGEPFHGDPPKQQHGRRDTLVQKVIAKARTLKRGEWLPVECGSDGQAASLSTSLRKHGYRNARRGLTVYIEYHAHHWIYPPGADGSQAVSCKCGEIKEGVQPEPLDFRRSKR